MTTEPDLAAWLLEQIAEDERIAGELTADGWPKHDGRVLSMERAMNVPWPDRWHPGLILRECDAKRRILSVAVSDDGRSVELELDTDITDTP